MSFRNISAAFAGLALVLSCAASGCGSSSGTSGGSSSAPVPADIQAVMSKPMYQNATWGLRVLKGNKVVIDLKPDQQFLIGSVRKVFTVGELLNDVGSDHTYDTPVYRQGNVTSGVLNGDLILVASGDLTMGGRTNPDGSIAVSNYDHNEANSLGNAVLTSPDPLAGYVALANRVAAAGITHITGEIAIDDRLFQPYFFRGEFDVRPIFVNDDCVDVSMTPTSANSPATLVSRPVSAALTVDSSVVTGGPGTDLSLQFDPEPSCIGTPGCMAPIGGQLPIDYMPPFTNMFPLVQTFRIVQPSNYARTVFIEALQAAGVTVDAAAVEQNPVQILPAKGSYLPANQVAQLTGLPYSDDAKLVLKVSYNIGADTSLLLFGVNNGADNMDGALAVEQENLAAHYGITPDEYHFLDGSGGGDTAATSRAVTRMFTDMMSTPGFNAFYNGLPLLGVDGSLAFVTQFQSDPTLTGATGQVLAKTGTFLQAVDSALVLKAQAMGGYVNASSGQRLVYQLVVNNVPVSNLGDVTQVFQDEGTISAMLWRDY